MLVIPVAIIVALITCRALDIEHPLVLLFLFLIFGAVWQIMLLAIPIIAFYQFGKATLRLRK